MTSPFARGLIFVIIAALLVGGIIFFNRILAGDAFTSEEAQHALYGFWIWRDIHTMDLGAFWYDTQRQMVWPFLHSWFLGLVFLFFAPGYVSARILSLFFFWAAIILIYLFSNELCDKKGWRVGVLAALLALTSPLMIQFASLNMMEGLGALLFILAAHAYMVFEEKRITIEYVFLALIIGLSIYINYLYAYLLIPSFVVLTLVRVGPMSYQAAQLRRRGEKEAMHFIWWAYRKLIVLGIVAFLSAIWFSFSFNRKITLLFESIFKYSGGTIVEGLWQNLFYYPRVIVENISFSPWLGLFLVAALFMPRIAARYRGLNRIYIYVWTTMVLLTLTIPTKAPHLLYIVVPFIFIIFAGVAVYFYDELCKTNKKLAMAFILIILLPSLLTFPRTIGLLFPAGRGESFVTVLDYFKTSIPSGKNIAATINLVHLNPDVIKFHFRDWQAEILADAYLSEDEIAREADYLVALDIDENSKYRFEVQDDSLFRWSTWLKDREMRGEIRLYSSRRFGQIGVTAKIYETQSSEM